MVRNGEESPINLAAFYLLEWKCQHALARLLFEEGKLQQLAKKVREEMTQNNSSYGHKSSAHSTSEWQQIARLKVLCPNLHADIKRHPIRWIRFAFFLQRNGFALSEFFIWEYAKWRDNIALKSGNPSVYWQVSEHKNPKRASLDYFIHSIELDVAIESDIVVWLAHDKSPPLFKKSKTADHVGARAYKVVSECVRQAAIEGRIKGLTSEMDERRRFISHLSKSDLTTRLQKKFSDVGQFSQSTVSRCLGDFAACFPPRKRK